jgi:hypothetical protein
MNVNNPPRQLKMNCTLSAVYLPELGSIFGVNARYKQQPDPANTLTASLVEELERNIYSPELGLISTGIGGFIPKLNLEIGAPTATFTEGAIVSDRPHGTLTLLKAAKVSIQNPAVQYVVPASTYASPRTSTTTSAGSGVSSPYASGGFPSIPSIKSGAFSGLTERETYNIWTQKGTDLSKAKWLLNFGVTNYKAIKGVQVETKVTQNGARIIVYAQNSSCLMSRIFPIGDDLLYNSPLLYYPKVGTIIKPAEEVKAKGGPNCGFWIHLDIIKQQQGNTNTGTINSEFLIYWGYPNKKPEDRKITEFVLLFSPNKSPSLRFKKPGTLGSNSLNNIKTTWGDMPLQEGPFLDSTTKTIDIFVHYAGPNMYIGFGTDISKWNVFEPIKVDQLTVESDDDAFYEPFQQKESIIEMYFQRMAASYTYSPICFNNFNSEYLTSSSSNTKNRILVNFDVPRSEYDSGSCSPASIEPKFIEDRRPNNSTDPAKEKRTPTYYGDWRRNKNTEADYIALPEFSYIQNSVQHDNTMEENPRSFVSGQIEYNTTIEGPVFFYLRNFPESEQRSKILKPIWKNYSDITSYLQSASVTVSYEENRNNSYKSATANLNFANLTNDLIGVQILNAIQENILVFTLKAGYDKDLKTFFQGISRKVTVSRKPDGFEVNVVCSDIGDTLLSDIRFNTTSSQSFNNREFRYILEDCFYYAGLLNTYNPREEIINGTRYDALYKNFFKKVIGHNGLNFPNSLAREVITVNKNKKIKDVIKILLSLMIYTPGDPFSGTQGLPVLYWDPEKEKFILNLRADEPKDTLFFAGDSSDPSGALYLANNNPDREHGIVDSQGWTEETDLTNLHSEIFFLATLANLKPFFRKSPLSFVKQSLSTSSLNDLDKFVINPATDPNFKNNFQSQRVIGYVGYHKEYLMIDETSNFFMNENIAREQFEIRQKYIRETFTSITLKVLVTKPLSSSGTFSIKSFEGGFENNTGDYVYSKIDYAFDINNNLITAQITGLKFPDLI